MIIQGRNLTISAYGVVLAGAKSCDIEVACDTIPVSSPTDGQWEHSIPGLKSWKVSTNHLLKIDTVPSHSIEAVGTSHKDGWYQEGDSYYILDGARHTGGTRGLTIAVYRWSISPSDPSGHWSNEYENTFDTYGNIDNCAAMASALSNAVINGDVVFITSFDAYSMNAALASAISTKLGIPLASLPVVNPGKRASFACVGVAGNTGIAFANLNEGSQAHAKLLLAYDRTPITCTPMKDILTKPGTTFTLQMQVDGLGYDRLSGTAICKNARVTGTEGNLAQGSFSFLGSGPLE